MSILQTCNALLRDQAVFSRTLVALTQCGVSADAGQMLSAYMAYSNSPVHYPALPPALQQVFVWITTFLQTELARMPVAVSSVITPLQAVSQAP